MPTMRKCRCGELFEVTAQYPDRDCCSKNCREQKYRERKRKAGRVGNAKMKIIKGPCHYCQPTSEKVRKRSYMCEHCQAIQLAHEAAQSGRMSDEDAEDLIYALANAVRAKRATNYHPQGKGRIPADVTLVELGSKRGRGG